MDSLRKPFFFAAIVFSAIIVLVEVGSLALLGPVADAAAEPAGPEGS
jgi:hypothetical protein